jgi:hypothetical protein
MRAGDRAAVAAMLFAAGFAVGLVTAEQGVEAQRLAYLAQCTDQETVWINASKRTVRCAPAAKWRDPVPVVQEASK